MPAFATLEIIISARGRLQGGGQRHDVGVYGRYRRIGGDARPGHDLPHCNVGDGAEHNCGLPGYATRERVSPGRGRGEVGGQIHFAISEYFGYRRTGRDARPGHELPHCNAGGVNHIDVINTAVAAGSGFAGGSYGGCFVAVGRDVFVGGVS